MSTATATATAPRRRSTLAPRAVAPAPRPALTYANADALVERICTASDVDGRPVFHLQAGSLHCKLAALIDAVSRGRADDYIAELVRQYPAP